MLVSQNITDNAGKTGVLAQNEANGLDGLLSLRTIVRANGGRDVVAANEWAKYPSNDLAVFGLFFKKSLSCGWIDDEFIIRPVIGEDLFDSSGVIDLRHEVDENLRLGDQRCFIIILPLIRRDVGLFFSALNGRPGSFIPRLAHLIRMLPRRQLDLRQRGRQAFLIGRTGDRRVNPLRLRIRLLLPESALREFQISTAFVSLLA